MALPLEDRSFPQLKYPSLRDSGVKDAYQWMAGKAMDDGAEGLWRVHDKLYDFTDFMKKHPGGEDWLLLTKGTDITEAFESHHISLLPEKMLVKFHVRDATTPRNSPFTFDEKGFYRTLKSRVREEMKGITKDHSSISKRTIEILATAMIIFSLLSCIVTYKYLKLSSIFLAGLFMCWTTISAHNFFHLKDNWRMYLFNFCGMDCREWRITHALSHHQFPNTLMDFEISSFEPMIHWLPSKNKTFVKRYAPWFYSLILYFFTFDLQFIVRVVAVFKGKLELYKSFLIPFILPTVMYVFSDQSLASVLVNWLAIIHVGSFLFTFIGVNAAHHHPDIFHEGDEPHADSDWGVHQLSAVMDRREIEDGGHFHALTNFGHHALHHMFPTLDHAVLPLLYPAFNRTAEEFKTQLRITGQLDLLLGQFRQLARNVPKRRDNNNANDKNKNM